MLFFFSSRRRHTRYWRDWSSDVCSSDLSILPNGRLVTPVGRQVTVAPHPYGLCLSRDGRTLVASSSGTDPFALAIIRDPASPRPGVRQLPSGAKTDPAVLNATFMGLAVSPDGATLYASGGDDGTVARFDL